MPVRNDRERSRVLRFERLDVIIALGLAGIVSKPPIATHTPLTPDVFRLSSARRVPLRFGTAMSGCADLRSRGSTPPALGGDPESV
jgi:hypothetical protein